MWLFLIFLENAGRIVTLTGYSHQRLRESDEVVCMEVPSKWEGSQPCDSSGVMLPRADVYLEHQALRTGPRVQLWSSNHLHFSCDLGVSVAFASTVATCNIMLKLSNQPAASAWAMNHTALT